MLAVDDAQNLLTPSETAIVAGAPLRAVYKVAKERLPKHFVVRKLGKTFLTYAGALCVRLDRDLPKDVPVKVRWALYAKLVPGAGGRVEHDVGPITYVLEAGPAQATVARELAAYRLAMQTVVEDADIQGGAATFKGTRLIVHQVASLLAQGASAEELKADYPNLTDTMIAAAPIYARTHPKRGRPRSPTWRVGEPLSEFRRPRSA